ncbi:unnamed protein product [Lota lota]
MSGCPPITRSAPQPITSIHGWISERGCGRQQLPAQQGRAAGGGATGRFLLLIVSWTPVTSGSRQPELIRTQKQPSKLPDEAVAMRQFFAKMTVE